MPLYSYTAIDSNGKRKTGLIEAMDELEAKTKLRDQKVMLTKLHIKTGASGKENIRGEKLHTFTLLLAQLVNSGLPLYDGLLALEEQFRDEPFHRVILSLCDRVKGGAKLSSAMNHFPGSFNTLYVSMVDAGESAGALGPVLVKLAELLEKQNKLKKEITQAMVYPSILILLSLTVITVLFTFVIPSIEGIFSGRELNWYTAFVMKISFLFRNYWWIYAPMIIAIISMLVYFFRTHQGRLWLQKKSLEAPFLKRIVIESAIAKFCRTMGTLQKGGLTMVDSLEIAKFVMGNHLLEEEITKAQKKIIEGSSLSRELSQSKRFPHMVFRMLKVGEESGTVDEMFHKIADIYEGDIEKTLAQFLAFLSPVILIVMGVFIFFVLLAVFIPLSDISSLTR